MSSSSKIALGFAAALGTAACVLLVVVLAGRGLQRASLWAAVLAALTGMVAAVAAIWPLVARPSKVLPPPALEVPEWVVDRPAEASAVVAALLARRVRQAEAAGITTGLYGAGGFGKTVLARVVCADRRVRRRFGGTCTGRQ